MPCHSVRVISAYVAANIIKGITSKIPSRNKLNACSYSLEFSGQSSLHLWWPKYVILSRYMMYIYVCVCVYVRRDLNLISLPLRKNIDINWQSEEKRFFLFLNWNIHSLTLTGRNQTTENGNRWHEQETTAPNQCNQFICMTKRLPSTTFQWMNNGIISFAWYRHKSPGWNRYRRCCCLMHNIQDESRRHNEKRKRK